MTGIELCNIAYEKWGTVNTPEREMLAFYDGYKAALSASQQPASQSDTIDAQQVLDDERKAFEAWFFSHSPKHAAERDGDHYKYMPAQSSWFAWQARAARQQPAEAPPDISDARIRGIAVCDGGGYQDDEDASWEFDAAGLLKFARALLRYQQ